MPAAPFVNLKVGENLLRHCSRLGSQGDALATRLGHCANEVIAGGALHHRLEYAAHGARGIIWFEVTIEPLRRPEGGAVLVWTDVTYRKQAEAKERAQQQQLVHLGRAAVLGELSGAFAHELSQPLTSILGNAEAALQLLTKPDADLREIRNMVRDIVADDVRAAEVIQRLRAMLHARRDLARARRPGQRHQGRARPRAHRSARRGTCPSTWHSIPTCRWCWATASSCSRWCSTWS